jgi:phospholipase A1
MKYKIWLLCLFSCLYFKPALAETEFEHCLVKKLSHAGDTVTVGELKALCQQTISIEQPDRTASATQQRYQLERHENNPFSLLPHRPNYLILSNNFGSRNETPFNEAFPNKETRIQPWETKFQISFKVPVARDLFNKAELFIAYTNRSFFQQFNKKNSAPFRDSNHEPEAWLSFKNDVEFLGFKNSIILTGFSHQSNGQSGSLSRSWNRLYADFLIEKGNWYFSLKPWWRIPESSDSDDNPDIDDYLGNFELGGLYKYKEQTFNFLVRNNLDFGDNHGAIELGWSMPISDNVRGYVQWFNGYGESLIDYNAHVNSIGFGIQLTDWL